MISAAFWWHRPNANADHGWFARPRPDGVIGDLVQTTAGRWITHPPTRCPNGHSPGRNQVPVGHEACLGHGGGGHTSWQPHQCRRGVRASHAPHALEGPATSRLTGRVKRVVIVHLTPVRLAPFVLLSRVAAWHGTGRGELADVADRHGNAVEHAVSCRLPVSHCRRTQMAGRAVKSSARLRH
jgi:hypothetical protein